ncbi:MAG: DUF1802 family protein [Candidatus Bipolaricaulia bacterium]
MEFPLQLAGGVPAKAEIIEALATGRHLFLIRKRARRSSLFLLYPSLSPPSLKRYQEIHRPWLAHRRRTAGEPPIVRYLATLDQAVEVENDDRLWEALEPYYVWSLDAIRKYLNGRERAYLWLVRVYRLSEPGMLTKGDYHAGAWVRLAEPIEVEQAEPTLEETRYVKLRDEVVGIAEELRVEGGKTYEHNLLVDYLGELGAQQGFETEIEVPCGRFKIDVVWRPTYRGAVPRYAFEVHIGGNLHKDLAALKHAYDLWNARITLISTAKDVERICDLVSGTFHEIEDELKLVEAEQFRHYVHFKQRFSDLERVFG